MPSTTKSTPSGCAVSGADFDETGDVAAAVSASGPMARISDDRMTQLGALVLEASRAISRDMNANPAKP